MSDILAAIDAYNLYELIASTSTSEPDQVDLGDSTSVTGWKHVTKTGICKLIADGKAKRKLGREAIVKKTMGPVHGG